MTNQYPQNGKNSNSRSVVTYVPIGSISPDPNNPRVHTRQQVQAIARSIQAFGFNTPILINKDGQIVAGHGRLAAAKLRQMTEVPVIRLEHLTEQQAKAYLLADNKLSDRSSWDDTQLALRLKELHEIVLDFDIEATGFEAPEIDIRIQSLERLEEADAADAFQAPEGPSVSELGDLWMMGKHRLICGNALEPVAYDTLLGSEKPGAMFVDPPYNVVLDGHAVGNGRTHHREFAMAAGEMCPAQFSEFLFAFLNEARSRMNPDAVAFVCMDWRHIGELTTAIGRCECEVINLCVWDKGNAGMGSLYRSGHELVFVIRGQGAQHLNNVQLGRFGRNRTNIWRYPGMNSFAASGRREALGMHPTVKPIAMVADAILDVTRRGDIVLDPFFGSGTTILAAERTGRRGYGIELDPLYVDLTIGRWQKMTGRSATHACGKTFAEIREERADANAEA